MTRGLGGRVGIGVRLAGVLATALLLAGAAPAAGKPKPVASPYYLARGDPRLCPSPVCGGLFVHLVNRSRSVCGDGARRPACYVASADLSALDVATQRRSEIAGLLAQGRALARGRLARGLVPGFPQLDTLVVTEIWRSSSSARLPSGTFRRLADNGVRCVAAPCFSTDADALDRSGRVTVSRVRLAGVGATTPERNRALALIATGELIASGGVVVVPRAGPAGAGRVFVASQFYVQMR